MHESERARMKHRTRRFDLRAGIVADVHAFADQRMTELGQVDSNLMLASGFEAAFDQRGTREVRDRSDVRNRTFSLDRGVAGRTSEMSVRAAYSIPTMVCSRNCTASACFARAVRVNTINPLVSLSRR